MAKKQSKDLGKDVMLGLYRTMLIIRRSEEQLVKSHQAGLIPGACHTYIGEEAVATGVCANLKIDDVVISTHRGHGHALAKGVTPRELIAELYGKATGCSGGRGGSMHLFKPEVGLLGTSGIVAPSITLATGAAYTYDLLQENKVAVSFFSDGAVNNGSFHEGINLATAWQLPAIFVCENNLYATEVAFADVSKNPSVASKAASYGLPGVEVDGNDVIAVYQAAEEAVERAKSGNGPTLLECKTYRYRAHAEGMRDAGYRTKEEIDEWKKRDAIDTLGKKLVDEGTATKAELDGINSEVTEMIADAHAFALDSPFPDPATVLDHVYSTP